MPIDIPFPAYKGTQDYVFVSYSHADARLVYPELERLKRLGYNVWYDEGVSPGSRWSDELALRIQNCSLFLVLVTPGVAKSVHCQDELNYVLEAERPVLAMHIAETELPPGIKLRLGARQAIFAYKLSSQEIDRKLGEVFSTIGIACDRESASSNTAVLDLKPGDNVGNFHLLEVLGEGGMGTVFLAEQREPVARRVALKVIKLGMDTKEVLARFEAERQALSLLAHNNIATVYESGATSTGRPYFVMEYVAGKSITEYCDDKKLSFKQRIKLLKQACRGVLHAHQKGIIHRDLKSSNLIVTESAGEPIVKIIDFGIAKSMQGSLSNVTLYTKIGDAVGSPGYASPEQMSGNMGDIDTRTDVYSLGIVLYELLTGMRPFDDNTFIGRDSAQIHDLLRSTEPPLPSTRLTKDATLVTRANVLSTTTDKIFGELKGDLSSIVMKAIRSEREDRYPSVSALSADLERYLTGAPVEATPQTALYLFSRFVKRHSAGVAISISVFLLLVAATITSTYFYIRASEEATRANLMATQSQTTVDFLLKLFEGSSPDNSPDPSLTARDLLDQGAIRLTEQSDLDAAVRLQLSETVADVYLRLWLPKQAITLLRKTILSTIDELGENHVLIFRAQVKLGDVLRANDELEEAKAILSSVKKSLNQVEGITIDDKARLFNNLALVLSRLNETSQAEELYLQALDLRKQEQGDRSLSVAVTLHNLALLYMSTDQLDLAEQFSRRSLDIRKELFDEKHSRVATSLDVLAGIFERRGQFEEATELMNEVVLIRRKVFGDDNQVVATSLYNLAKVQIESGSWQAAIENFEKAMSIDGKGTVDWAFSAYRLAFLEQLQGNNDRSYSLATAAMPLMQQQYGNDYRHVAHLKRLIASLHVDLDLDLSIAESLARESVNTFILLSDEENINVALANMSLAEVLNAKGNEKLAVDIAKNALNIAQKDTAINKRNLAVALLSLGNLYNKSNRIGEACAVFNDLINLRLSNYTSEHPYVDLVRQKLMNC